MSIVAIASAALIPHVNVNSNMARYLPDASPMKRGMDIIYQELPALLEQSAGLGGVFADGEALMPTDLPQTLALGVALLFGVLLVMSASVMEVLLFLLTIGFAVAINMGTNALLPSVSMMTNTLASVLQMVLSMDYSIILMNRYRQEKLMGKAPVPAMEEAVGGAASAIFSSAFTTVVSLLMLCFIKLKIGADLGVVLAKGVTLSLLCNFTVLPALIIWADKAVDATRKKVPKLPSAGLSRFQYRYRIPLTVVFVLVFAAFAFLQRQTPLSFSPQWDSEASEVHVDGNAFMLLYANEEEDQVPALLDSIGALPKVKSVISYPSLLKRPRTIRELKAMAGEFAVEGQLPDLPDSLLSLVYYAKTHPVRTEQFSLQELMALSDEFSAKGLVPEGFSGYRSFVAPAPQDDRALHPAPQDNRVSLPSSQDDKAPLPAPVILSASEESPVKPQADTLSTSQDSGTVTQSATPPVILSVSEESPDESPSSFLSYSQATTPVPAAQMATLLGQDPSQVSMIYRLAGRRKGTMTPREFIAYVQQHIIGNRRYAAFIPKGTEEQLSRTSALLDSVLAAGPDTVQLAAALPPPAAPDTLLGSPALPDSLPAPPKPQEVVVEVPETKESEAPAPQEVLIDMMLSGKRYSSAQIYPALKAAGVPVKREEIDLLYLYAGAQRDFDPETAISPEALLTFLSDTLLTDPALSRFVPDSAKTLVTEVRAQLTDAVGMLRGKAHGAAAVLTGYEVENEEVFCFVDSIRSMADSVLEAPHYWVGESEMYKELKDGFPDELLLLTLLTVLAIFLIVALTFRSVLIPIPLIMTVLSGVYVNVWASGLGSNTLYYLSYLIIQGILMGATIDYSILFTTYYLDARRLQGVEGALASAYNGASHSILTSGLILVLVPYVMSVTLKDAMIAGILSSLSLGALAVLLLILFFLPAVLAALDRLLGKRG